MSDWRTDLHYLYRLLREPGLRRHAWRWWRARRQDATMVSGLPWLVFGAIDRLGALELAGRRVFEYGSGGSTLYWQRRGALCVSVESDPGWYARLRARLAATPAVDYRLVTPEPGEPGGDPADPDAYVSASATCRGLHFRRYVSVVDEFPDGYFDLVLVDGRARPSCVKHAAPKLAPGGTLVVDNTDRPYVLARVGGYLEGFAATRFAGPCPAAPVLSETTVFTRVR